jgi:hypothetical protein
MKRLIALLLIAAVLFTLAACGKKDNSVAVHDSVQAASEAAQSAEEAAQAEAEPAPEQSSGPVDDGSAIAPEVEQNLLDDSEFEQINAATGANISRPTAVSVDQEAYELVEENGAQIAQYTFLSGSVNCGVRYCGDTSVDITGVTDENGNSPFLASSEDVVNIGGALMARWLTANGQYVLIATTEEEEQFYRLYEEMKAITGG